VHVGQELECAHLAYEIVCVCCRRKVCCGKNCHGCDLLLQVGKEQERACFAHKVVRAAQTAIGLFSHRCMLGRSRSVHKMVCVVVERCAIGWSAVFFRSMFFKSRSMHKMVCCGKNCHGCDLFLYLGQE
jgi:hypothetical protein